MLQVEATRIGGGGGGEEEEEEEELINMYRGPSSTSV
jgi:hypothetical protein